MADARGAEPLDGQQHRAGPAELARVRDPDEPGIPGDPERLLEVPGVSPGLVVGQPEAHDAPPGELACDPGVRLRVARVPRPVRGDHEAGADPVSLTRGQQRVEHHLDRGVQPAEAGGVRRRVHLELQPADARERLVLDDLGHHPPYLGLGAQQVASLVVQALELVPAPQAGGVEVDRGGLEQAVRERDPLLLGKIDKGVVTHPAGEVQVEVRLGERLQSPHVPYRGSPVSQAVSSCLRGRM